MHWRRLLLAGILLVVLVGLCLARPRLVVCLTTEHTYCPNQLQELTHTLANHSFFWAPHYYAQLSTQAAVQEPALAQLSFRRRWDWSIMATAEMSPIVLPIQVNGQDYAVRANGWVTTSDYVAQPLFILVNPDQWLNTSRSRIQGLTPQELQNLSKLYQQYQQFTPRVTKITLHSLTELNLSLEGKSPIIVRADEEAWLEPQLTALQGFFRSSTIATDYQEVDARFTDLVVR